MYRVLDDGEEKTVATNIQVRQTHDVYHPAEHQTITEIGNGNGIFLEDELPDAVTRRSAQHIWSAFQVDVRDHGIEVIDPEEKEII